ncbi:MAG: helix-hairpin-helix domain-containing protein [Crocinitomicaceae bacterium]|nr:helix-hairpin-helix domain-containing protein [Crocinitomicaceae bacterium]
MLCIAALISYTPRIIAAYSGQDKIQISFEELERIEEEIDEKREHKKFSKKKVWTSKFKVPPEAFDPNEYLAKDWLKLGLSKKQVDVVLNFSKRGLRSNEDLKKIFVISSELFSLIKDSTFYPEFNVKKEVVVFVEKEFIKVDINSADMDKLKSIPGIGDFYAKKIVEYRNELGGYIEKVQLLEIWKFDDEKYNQVIDKIVLSANEIQLININTCSIDDLKKHPYIDYKVANSIVKMRMANGDYSHIEDILESKLINRELFLKIRNYLKI